MLDLDTLTALYRHWASRLAFTIADDFGANVASGMTQNDARSAIGQNLVRAATAHSFLTMMINFVQGVRKVRYPGLKPVLTRLCQLFGAYYAEEVRVVAPGGWHPSSRSSFTHFTCLPHLPPKHRTLASSWRMAMCRLSKPRCCVVQCAWSCQRLSTMLLPLWMHLGTRIMC